MSGPSPIRFWIGDAVGPPKTAPTPWTAMTTPRNVGGRCRPWLTTAKQIDSKNPTTSSVIPPAMTIWRSTIVFQMWWTPAVTSTNQWTSSGTGLVSSTCTKSRLPAAIRNVAASTIATTPPPATANSPAPVSGPTSRRPSRTVVSTPRASPISSSGSITFNSADWPALRNV